MKIEVLPVRHLRRVDEPYVNCKIVPGCVVEEDIDYVFDFDANLKNGFNPGLGLVVALYIDPDGPMPIDSDGMVVLVIWSSEPKVENVLISSLKNNVFSSTFVQHIAEMSRLRFNLIYEKKK